MSSENNEDDLSDEDHDEHEHEYLADERIDDDSIDRLDRKSDQYKMREKEDNALKVVESVFDNKTRMILLDFINKGIINEVSGAISTGKEANVYYAPSDDHARAIKIFRIDVMTFKKMRPYINGDHRFKRFKSSRSGFIEAWTKKEYKNLQRLNKQGIPSPEPIAVDRNILIMEYLGTDDAVLPRLKDVEVEKPSKLYKAIMNTVKDMYQKAKLVHADLSEFNILYNQSTGEYYIIDVSQAVLWDHPRAEEFLIRDIHNMNRFFSYYGVETIELRRLYRWIVGDDPSEALVAEVIGL